MTDKNMTRIKTAVVGVGSLGRHHLKWYAQLEQSDLVGLYDIDTDKSHKYAEQYKVRAFESLDELISRAEAVSIVVPTSAHFEVASQVIQSNTHCLIEKPITATLDEATKLQHLASDKGVTVSVGMIERFNPAVQALNDLDVQPSFIEAHRLAAFDPRGTDVAVILDLMIHDIDLAIYLIQSKVTDIQASAVAVISERADIANARLTFENGAVANLTASRISLQPMRKLRLFQRSGYFSLDLAAKQADIYLLDKNGDSKGALRIPIGTSGRDLLFTKRTDTGEDMLGQELSSFLRAVSDNSAPAVSISEATESLRVALEVAKIGSRSIAHIEAQSQLQ